MADALKYEGKTDTRETERFIRTFDKFFDLMNVRSLKEGHYKRKENLLPYLTQSDDRLLVSACTIDHKNIANPILLQWLENDFLSYLKEWDESVSAKDLSASDMARMCISRETLEGLRFTGEHMHACYNDLLGIAFHFNSKIFSGTHKISTLSARCPVFLK